MSQKEDPLDNLKYHTQGIIKYDRRISFEIFHHCKKYYAMQYVILYHMHRYNTRKIRFLYILQYTNIMVTYDLNLIGFIYPCRCFFQVNIIILHPTLFFTTAKHETLPLPLSCPCLKICVNLYLPPYLSAPAPNGVGPSGFRRGEGRGRGEGGGVTFGVSLPVDRPV
jgi:hypothetical protein